MSQEPEPWAVLSNHWSINQPSAYSGRNEARRQTLQHYVQRHSSCPVTVQQARYRPASSRLERKDARATELSPAAHKAAGQPAWRVAAAGLLHLKPAPCPAPGPTGEWTHLWQNPYRVPLQPQAGRWQTGHGQPCGIEDPEAVNGGKGIRILPAHSALGEHT